MTTDHSLSRVASRLGVAGLLIALTWHAALSARARAVPQAGSASVEPLRLGDLVLSFDARGLTGMAASRDRFGAQVLAPGGRLGVMLKYRVEGGEDPDTIFEKSWTKHQFISGHASFLYLVRPNGEPPYLMVTTQSGTKLEYSTSPGGRGNGFLAFMHSALTGGSETRAILFDEGLFDVRVAPGMTVPDDLDAQFSLHTKARIESVPAEFPAETVITSPGEPRPGHRLYRVRFSRLGENRLTIVHDGGRETHLEFFVTEPLETLIKKRAHFIATRQQHRDPARWYDLFTTTSIRSARSTPSTARPSSRAARWPLLCAHAYTTHSRVCGFERNVAPVSLTRTISSTVATP